MSADLHRLTCTRRKIIILEISISWNHIKKNSDEASGAVRNLWLNMWWLNSFCRKELKQVMGQQLSCDPLTFPM